jgi:hypothetical protein
MDIMLLNDIATNRRTITSDKFGTFVIKRPTYAIESQVEAAKARQTNADLQTRHLIEDPMTGDKREVPAFLSRHAKGKELRFHGLWSDELEEKLNNSAEEYRDVALRLDADGFEGGQALNDSILEVKASLHEIFGDGMVKEIETVCPTLTRLVDVPIDMTEAMSVYGKARKALSKAGKSRSVDDLLDAADRNHRLLMLYREGLQAQTTYLAYRINELELFSETIEARSEQAGRIAKVFFCTEDEDGKSPWANMSEMLKVSKEKMAWLLGEIERFERLDPEDMDADGPKKDRFNFLAAFRVSPAAGLEDSPETDPSSQDSASAEDTSSTSIEPLGS